MFEKSSNNSNLLLVTKKTKNNVGNQWTCWELKKVEWDGTKKVFSLDFSLNLCNRTVN